MSNYVERVFPPKGLYVATMLLIPAVTLMLGPYNWFLAFVISVVVWLISISILHFGSPRIVIKDGELILGRAQLPVSILANPVVLTGKEAYAARGPSLTADTYLQIRGGVDAVVKIENKDNQDPYNYLLLSTRRPAELVAALTS
jgi:hypothetical protein